MIDYGTLLRDHVTLRCRSIDRIFLQAYVPRLQAVGEVCTFLRWQRKFPIPSSAAFGRIGNEYLKTLYRFAEAKGHPRRSLPEEGWRATALHRGQRLDTLSESRDAGNPHVRFDERDLETERYDRHRARSRLYRESRSDELIAG